MRYEVVVVGGGTAGCIVASRLSEDAGRSVCLLEAGPDYGPYAAGRWPPEMLDARSLPFTHVWEGADDERTKARARLLGGGSAMNACFLVAGPPADYDWGSGWSWTALEPHARRAAETLRARVVQEHEFGSWHRALFDAARAKGLDVEPARLNALGLTRWNAAFAYVDPARGRQNLTIRDRTLVDRVEPPRVLLADGDALEAELIVLAAGAYGSAAILLRSGIEAGESLQDHPGVGLRYPDAPTAEDVPLSTNGLHGPNDLFAFTAQDGVGRSAAVFSMAPASRGRVRLRSRDPSEPPAVDQGFAADVDVQKLVEGVELLRRLLGPELEPGPTTDLERFVRENVRGFFHPVGTAALGRVADEDGRVFGADGLAVADASFIPCIPRAPTNLTVAAVAEKLAATFAAT
jgi:choline dehydrogenase